MWIWNLWKDHQSSVLYRWHEALCKEQQGTWGSTFFDEAIWFVVMEFCLEKYAKVTFRKGKLISSAAVELNIDRTICELDQDESYKYLDIDKKKKKKKKWNKAY